MMDTVVTGTNKDILKISTNDFTLYLSGNSENKKFRATNNHKGISSYISVQSIYENVKTYSLNSFKELEINYTNSMYPSFFEDGSYNIYLENDSDCKFEIYHIDTEIRDSIVSRRRDLYGSFKFNGDIGYSTFKVFKDEIEVLTFTIQVFPSKLDYIDDYNEILRDINEEINSLVFEFISKTFSRVEIKDVKNQTNLEFITILSNIYEKLEKSIKRIEAHPKHSVIKELNLKNENKAKKVSIKDTIKYKRKNKNSHNVLEIRKKTTLDIYENQLVKHMINKIIKKIKYLKKEIEKSKDKDNIFYNKLSIYESNLNTHLNSFFKDISDIKNNKSMTLVFKMASGYKEVYHYYNLLSKGLDICNGVYDINYKKLWNLYEIWCYIKIHNIIKELGYKTKNSSIIQVTSNGLTLSLLQNKESKCIYENDKGNKLELWYNKSYYGLPTTNQRPDTVLCLKNNKNSNRVYLFDAKYRLYIDNNGVIGPMEEDINVMHRYRDSIVSENKHKHYYKYETYGAYVMFPCSDEKSYKEHKFYKSIDKVNIGAIPMLPGSTSLMKKHICKLIDESYIEAINNNPIFDEEDDYYKFKNKNIMIVNVKDKEHFDVYRENNFYHIPKSALSKVDINVQYLAFYQPKKNFKNSSGINYFAKIKDIYEYKRGDCLELKSNDNNFNETYIRINVDEFKQIGPIKSVEYGPLTVNYTTIYLLNNADTMHELYLTNRREIEVYKVLKKFSIDKGLSLKKEKNSFRIGEDYVRIVDNNIIKFNDEIVDDLADFIYNL